MSASTNESMALMEGVRFLNEVDGPECLALTFTSKTIPINVGKEVADRPRTFHLHSELLINNSEYFAAALKARFKEGVQWHIELGDVHPTIFTAFVELLYLESLDRCPRVCRAGETVVPALVEVYALAERLICPRVQNAVQKILDKLFDKFWQSFSPPVICELLDIGSTKLYQFPKDPVTSRILGLALENLEALQGFDRFRPLLQNNRDLAVHISMGSKSKRWIRPGTPCASYPPTKSHDTRETQLPCFRAPSSSGLFSSGGNQISGHVLERNILANEHRTQFCS